MSKSKTVSILCTTVLLLLPLHYKDSLSVSVHCSLFLTLPRVVVCFCCCSLLLRCSSLQCCASVAVARSISIPGRRVSAVLSLSPHPSLSHCELQVTQQTHKDKETATCSCARAPSWLKIIFTHSCYCYGSHIHFSILMLSFPAVSPHLSFFFLFFCP